MPPWPFGAYPDGWAAVQVEDVEYLDFDLLIERVGRKYRARVLDSPAGPTSAIDFPRPVTKQALRIFLLTIGRPRQAVRRIDSPLKHEVKKFGGRLYDSVLGVDYARLEAYAHDWAV
jgi:hypothetical protein